MDNDILKRELGVISNDKVWGRLAMQAAGGKDVVKPEGSDQSVALGHKSGVFIFVSPKNVRELVDENLKRIEKKLAKTEKHLEELYGKKYFK